MRLAKPEDLDWKEWASLVVAELEKKINEYESKIADLEAQQSTNNEAIADHEIRIAVLEP